MKRVETSLSDKQYARALKVSKKRKISMYALLKEALLGYLDKYADKYADFLVGISDKIGEEVDDRFPTLSKKLDNAIDPERIPQVVNALYDQHTGKVSFTLAERITERERERLNLLLQTVQRVCELPPEKLDAYIASLEGLLKQVESEKPP